MNDIFPKSEKWLIVVVVLWACVMVSLAFYTAWCDPERYLDMIDAVGQSVQIVMLAIVAGAAAYSNARMNYKSNLAKLNPFRKEDLLKELGIKPNGKEVKENE